MMITEEKLQELKRRDILEDLREADIQSIRSLVEIIVSQIKNKPNPTAEESILLGKYDAIQAKRVELNALKNI